MPRFIVWLLGWLVLKSVLLKFVVAVALMSASLSVVAQGGAVSSEADRVRTAINSTDLGRNLQTLQNYYEEVNRQLDKRLKRKPRDPFAATEYTAPPPEPVAVEEPQQARFMPRSAEEFLDRKALGVEVPPENVPARGGLPFMNFRGYLQTGTGRAGLLDIEGIGAFIVREGDKVGLQQLGSDTVLRVVEINALNLIVEVGSLGEKLVVQ